jgi:hypothetical protein
MSIDLKHVKTSLSQFKWPENKNTRMHHQLIPSLALTSLRLPTKLKWRLNLGTESQWGKSSVKNRWFMAWGTSKDHDGCITPTWNEVEDIKDTALRVMQLFSHALWVPSFQDQRWSALINCRFKYVESSVAKLVKCLAILRFSSSSELSEPVSESV